MRIMNGWTIEWIDVAVGIVGLAGLVVIGVVIRLLKQIVEFDVCAEECRDDCPCPGSGHEPREEPDTCRRCGRYVEIGGE